MAESIFAYNSKTRFFQDMMQFLQNHKAILLHHVKLKKGQSNILYYLQTPKNPILGLFSQNEIFSKKSSCHIFNLKTPLFPMQKNPMSHFLRSNSDWLSYRLTVVISQDLFFLWGHTKLYILYHLIHTRNCTDDNCHQTLWVTMVSHALCTPVGILSPGRYIFSRAQNNVTTAVQTAWLTHGQLRCLPCVLILIMK